MTLYYLKSKYCITEQIFKKTFFDDLRIVNYIFKTSGYKIFTFDKKTL